jgi:MFS family permease
VVDHHAGDGRHDPQLSGALLDWLGTRVGFAIFVVGWGVANMCHAFSTGWFSLAFWRGLLGSFEAAAIPGGLKVVSEWFPPRERTVATGVFNMGSSIGNMIAPALVAFCILYFGWQSAFLITGGLSLIFAVVWYVAYRSPEQSRRLSQAELAHIQLAGDDAGVVARPAHWREVVRTKSFWSIAIPRFFAEPAWQTFNFFIPLYLVTVWNFNLKDLALWAWLPFLAADAGSMIGGLIAPRVDPLVRGRSAYLAQADRDAGRAVDGRAGLYRVGDVAGYRHRALLRRRVRAPDAVGRAAHLVRGPVRQEGRRHRDRHGRVDRVDWRRDLHADRRRPGRRDRL